MNIRKNIDYSEMYKALDGLMAQRLPQNAGFLPHLRKPSRYADSSHANWLDSECSHHGSRAVAAVTICKSKHWLVFDWKIC